MPIFWGNPTEMELLEQQQVSDWSLILFLFTPVVDKMYPQLLNALCVSAAQCENVCFLKKHCLL